jgi:hypothetical protein
MEEGGREEGRKRKEEVRKEINFLRLSDYVASWRNNDNDENEESKGEGLIDSLLSKLRCPFFG